MQRRGRRYGLLPILVLYGILSVLLAFSRTVNNLPVSLYCWSSSCSFRLVAFSLDCWPSPYTVIYCWPSPNTVGLLPILLAFSLYCWPSPYTVGLFPILLAFSLYCCPAPYTVGLLPILLALLPIHWPSPYTVGHLLILLAFSLYCCLSTYMYTVGLIPILLAFSLYYFLYSWPSPILLDFSLYEPLSIVHLCSISVPLFTMCIADLWDTHTTLVHGHFQQVTHAQLQCGHSM